MVNSSNTTSCIMFCIQFRAAVSYIYGDTGTDIHLKKCFHMIAFHAAHIIGFGSSLCINVHQVFFNEIFIKFLIIIYKLLLPFQVTRTHISCMHVCYYSEQAL